MNSSSIRSFKLAVCNIGGAKGNVNGSAVYSSGDSCSSCPTGLSCYENLCGYAPPAAASTTTTTTTQATTTTAAVCVQADLTQQSNGTLTSAQQSSLVSQVNNYRAALAAGGNVTNSSNATLPAAANMLQFSYNSTLESLAAAFVMECASDNSYPTSSDDYYAFVAFVSGDVGGAVTYSVTKNWGQHVNYNQSVDSYDSGTDFSLSGFTMVGGGAECNKQDPSRSSQYCFSHF